MLKKFIAWIKSFFVKEVVSSVDPNQIKNVSPAPVVDSAAQAVEVKAVSTDSRSTADIVAECNKLAEEIHTLEQEQSQGKPIDARRLTECHQEQAHNELELKRRFDAGDKTAVFKSPYAR